MSIYLNILIFALVFLGVTLWVQLKLFFSSLHSPKGQETSLSDPKLLSLVQSKTGYKLDKIYLASSDKLFGVMPSFLKPHLIISRALYENFDADELEYVLLHEMAHFLLHHVLTESLAGLLFLISGITMITIFGLSLPLVILLGFIFAIAMIRFGRLHEYEADEYSLSRMSNPRGMITATDKFQAQYSSPKYKILEDLFYRGNPFRNRIIMAGKEMYLRQED